MVRGIVGFLHCEHQTAQFAVVVDLNGFRQDIHDFGSSIVIFIEGGSPFRLQATS